MKTRILFLMLFFGIIATSQAQVSISAEGSDPHESAMLDVTSTNKGLLIPRMTSAERAAIINPANGLMVFDNSTNTFWFYSQATAQWEEMGGAIVNVLNDLLDAKTDANSIYIGDETATNDDGDNYNVALGQNSMKENTSGSHNAATGYGALENNSTGKNNVAFGDNALNSPSDGHKNTALGKGAGQNTANNSSNNIFIGYNAGRDEQGSHKLYIENTESPTPLIGGDFETDEVIINGDLEITNGLTVLENVNAQADLNVNFDLNVGMNATINNNLNVAENITTNALKITGGTPSTGKVLTSDNNGNATWQNAPSGVEGLNDLNDARAIGTNVLVGESSGLNISGNNNVSLGFASLFNNENSFSNVAIGYAAGYTANPTTASGNIYIGSEAGAGNTENNQLFIDNSGTETPLIYGDFATDHLTFNGTIAITGGNPEAGKVLTTDDNGVASWETLADGVQVVNDLGDAKTDANSVFIGAEAGLNDDGDNSNVAIGVESLKLNISGENNTAVGNLALTNNLIGEENSAFGSMALGNNTGGNRNTAIGQAALVLNETGSDNVAVGDRSLFWNTGDQNTVIGKGAGMNSNLTSGNIFIGYEAGKDEDGSNKLYIENSDSPTPLIGGDFDTNEVEINGSLDINGTLKITGGNPEAGKVLTTDDNGNASWENTSSGAEELNDLSDASSFVNSLYLGLNSGQNQVNDNYNTAVGQYSLMNSTNGFSNTAIGNSAMLENTDGHNNTAIGISALHLNTNGNQNTTVGSYSLYNNMGNYNTAIGYQAGQGTGAYNTMGNVLIGYQAGYYEIESGKLYIENSNSTTPLIGGDFNTDEVVINGTLAITGGNPAEGKVLVSDADGKASWEDAAGAQNINGLEDGKTHSSSLYIGDNAGANDDDKSGNTGIGFYSLQNNETGMQNTAIGTSAMGSTHSGHYNVAIGSTALQTNLNGSQNTVIGYRAGIASEIRDISGSVMIGHKAGYDETEDNKLYIENSDSSTPLIGGDFSTDEVTINGTLEITGGNPGDGKVLVSDADGKASWQNAAGAQNIDELSDAKNDNSSIFLGSTGGTDSGNNSNTAVGISALNSNQIGAHNTAFGHSSLTSNNSGQYNAAFGASSLELNTNGVNNTAIGSGALYNNGSGTNNTALGFEAGFGSYGSNASGNVFLGNKAGYFETGSNKLYIDNSDTYYPLIYGDFTEDKLEVNGEFKVANGSYSNLVVNDTKLEANVNIEANANVDIAGDLTIEGQTTTNGPFMANDKIRANDQIIANGPILANHEIRAFDKIIAYDKIEAHAKIEAHDDIVLSDDKNITYETPRTGVYRIHPSALTNANAREDLGIYEYTNNSLIFKYSSWAGEKFYAPVQLPDGVTLKTYTVYFSANGLVHSYDLRLYRNEPGEYPNSVTNIYDYDTTVTEFTEITKDWFWDPVIDNENYTYFIEVEVTVDYDVEFEYYGAKITYEYTTLDH